MFHVPVASVTSSTQVNGIARSLELIKLNGKSPYKEGQLQEILGRVISGFSHCCSRRAGPTRLGTRFTLYPPATVPVNYSKNHNSYSFFHRLHDFQGLFRAALRKHVRLRF